MISPELETRLSDAAAMEDCLRCSLACQLACIAFVDAGLKRLPNDAVSAVIRACLGCLDACMLLGTTSVLNRGSSKESVPYLLNCIDACATCEAECRDLDRGDLLLRRCGVACNRLRERCRRLVEQKRRASASASASND
jgi:hypothetical protein